MRHVDQVVVTEAVRRIGHAGEAEISAVREHRGQQGWLVCRRVAGAQMREAIGESGPGIDIAQDFGDAHPRQHPVQSDGQVARRFRHRRLHPGDVEIAFFDLDAIEFAACRPRHYEIQPLMQRRPAIAHVAVGIDLLIDADVARGFGG